MNTNKRFSIFQIAMIAIFGLLALAGVVAFATYRAPEPASMIGKVDIWGTYDADMFNRYLRELKEQDESLKKVSYRELDPSDFRQDVLEAMASGNSPDLLFIPEYVLYPYLDKIVTIPSSSYSRSDFINNFVDASEIYFQNDGIVGLPLAVDPLVVYWNRDIFASAGVPRPPSSWTEYFSLAQKLSQVDESLSIKQSAIALGESDNINYFREIMATLILQIGNPIISRDEDGRLRAQLEGDRDTESAQAAVRFFTEFSNASKAAYSWNRSMPTSRDAFLAGDLAIYLAPISDIFSIRVANPNLNFAIAEIPSVDTTISRRKAVYATLYGFVIPKVSDNRGGAYQAAIALTSDQGVRTFTGITGLGPARRDQTAESSEEAYRDIVKREALYAQTFLDPQYQSTQQVLADMVEYVTSGQRSISNALYVSNAALRTVINNAK
ncbi:MAG: ABC transporter substrate-binding protein [Patescibacteria group bacterium]